MSTATRHAARRESPLARLTRLARRHAPAPVIPDLRDGRSELYLAAEARREAEMHAAERHHEAPHGIARPEVLDAIIAEAAQIEAGPVHMCPPEGDVMPCCGLTPFEVPRTDRMTLNPRLVTCRTSAHDTMPDDRAPMPRGYAPGNDAEPEPEAYVPDLDADIRELPGLRAAIECHALRLHAGCQCAPEEGAEYLAWLASQYADLRPAETPWWATEPQQAHEDATAEMQVAA